MSYMDYLGLMVFIHTMMIVFGFLFVSFIAYGVSELINKIKKKLRR